MAALIIDPGGAGAARADRAAGRRRRGDRGDHGPDRVSKPTVIAGKRRYASEGPGGLEDRPKPGRPRGTDDVAIVLVPWSRRRSGLG